MDSSLRTDEIANDKTTLSMYKIHIFKKNSMEGAGSILFAK